MPVIPTLLVVTLGILSKTENTYIKLCTGCIYMGSEIYAGTWWKFCIGFWQLMELVSYYG